MGTGRLGERTGGMERQRRRENGRRETGRAEGDYKRVQGTGRGRVEGREREAGRECSGGDEMRKRGGEGERERGVEGD